ncbi:glycoside hydrolase family 25 protein [Allorhizobium terrae]|uniref:Glycoside hydrolase n=1 Tax=Allorhizobium terrae TaxID=1848972 RepID=A0A4S4A5S2_9HYPH|nr:GH25 family lysozyme [Allorhizobium terrae]THF53891.1 glycoside hydrolase [Allorhizobium terrae]TWD54600.1 lysozyme [Agrobacterium vitis]
MRSLILALMPLSLILASCTSTSYDFMETASIQPRFKDKDPQDFGINSPHRHQVHGIDVSKWNGDINWAQVKQSGVSFVFIKATEGKDVVDPRFAEYWQEARAAGMPHAPYHFYYFCSTADDQANWFIANVPRDSMALPPVIDVEWNHTSKTCTTRPSPEVVRAQMKRFMDRLEAYYGKRPIIYTSVDFHRDNLEGAFKDYYFWVRSVAKHPSEIYPDRKWAFWQYTSTGVIPGIKGNTDINVFAGTRKFWNKWVAAVSTPSQQERQVQEAAN